MHYTQITLLTGGVTEQNEILIALLGDIGFESFEENEQQLLAYIPSHSFNQELFDETLQKLQFRILYNHTEVADQNWNAVWESNFDPVTIAGRCHIRAPFHPAPEAIEFDLVIEPKMSFGTAHHETTALMIGFMLDNPPAGSRLLDMGCGTGVLAILALKSGATDVTAIDNDEWAYNNTLENAQRNKVPTLKVHLGDAKILSGFQPFETIFANINRNILLHDMADYNNVLLLGGTIYLSGFYENDAETIQAEAARYGWAVSENRSDNHWLAMKLVKKS